MSRVTANDIQFEYVIDGDPEVPAVFAITGFTDQLIDWPGSMISSVVDAGYCFHRYDSRDMGQSTYFDEDGAPGLDDFYAAIAENPTYEVPYDLHDMAHDALALIETFDLAPVHAVGYSMGGQILQLALIKAPELFASAALLFTTSGWDQLPTFTDSALEVAIGAATRFETGEEGRGSLEALLRFTNGTGFPKSDVEIRADASASYNRAYHPEGAARHLTALWEIDDYHDELATVEVPTLVVQGLDDALIRAPAHGHDLTARIPGARLIDIEGAGHNLAHALGPTLAGHIVDHIAAVS